MKAPTIQREKKERRQEGERTTNKGRKRNKRKGCYLSEKTETHLV
jgi:hypothetical protein